MTVFTMNDGKYHAKKWRPATDNCKEFLRIFMITVQQSRLF